MPKRIEKNRNYLGAPVIRWKTGICMCVETTIFDAW